MGVYQPALPAGGHSLGAYSAFFYVVNGIGLLNWTDASGVGGVQDITPRKIKHAGQSWCPRPWSEVKNAYSHTYCFSSAYIPAMLERFGVEPDSTQITFSRKLHGYKVEWSLGAQLYYASEDSPSSSLAADLANGASNCVPPEDPPAAKDASGCFHVGILIGLCVLNLVVGATLSQLCKRKQP